MRGFTKSRWTEGFQTAIWQTFAVLLLLTDTAATTPSLNAPVRSSASSRVWLLATDVGVVVVVVVAVVVLALPRGCDVPLTGLSLTVTVSPRATNRSRFRCHTLTAHIITAQINVNVTPSRL